MSGSPRGEGVLGVLPASHRFSDPRRGAAFWVALWSVAVAAELGALVPIVFSGGATVAGADVVYRLVGGSFAAFGLVAWHRRPDSRSGPLMTATGFGLLVSLLLKQIHAGVALTLGEVTEDIWAPAFVALLLSFVTGGRLVSRLDRQLVAGVFIAVFVLDVVSMLFVEQAGNVLLAFPSERIYGIVDTVQRVMLIALCVAAAAVIAGRWRVATAARRRALAPSVTTLAAFTLVAVVAGIGAAIMPARRASRLNVLEALHYE